jgi:hypothetical protein
MLLELRLFGWRMFVTVFVARDQQPLSVDFQAGGDKFVSISCGVKQFTVTGKPISPCIA